MPELTEEQVAAVEALNLRGKVESLKPLVVEADKVAQDKHAASRTQRDDAVRKAKALFDSTTQKAETVMKAEIEEANKGPAAARVALGEAEEALAVHIKKMQTELGINLGFMATYVPNQGGGSRISL